MVTILYTKKNSIYNTLNVDTWDIHRDARKWPGGNPIIAHPPCRMWGDHHWKAKGTKEEATLAIHAILMTRLYGGITEHPQKSKLWKIMKLPLPGQRDQYGGWTLSISQKWFGHRAEKKTFLYIVGIKPGEVPEYPIKLHKPTNTIENMAKPEREHTPIQFAQWLIKTASLCKITYNGKVELNM